MLASKYANEPDESTPQTPKRGSRQSVDVKPLPALPQSPAAASDVSARRQNASISSVPPTSPLKDRTGLDASSPKASAPTSPAVHRIKHASTERLDWSDDDPNTPFKPDPTTLASGFSPSRKMSAPGTPSKRTSMNANAPVFNFSPKASPTKPAQPAPKVAPQSPAQKAAPAALFQSTPADQPRPDPPARTESRLAPPPTMLPGLVSTPDLISRSDTVTPTVRGTKKIFSQKGKPCIIRVPAAAVHSRPGWMPLTRAETKARVDDFKRQGWDVRGFNHGMPTTGQDAGENHAQARPMWPDLSLFHQGEKKERQDKPAVIFPNKKHWDDYVNYLIEEKLKGLGVVKAPSPQPEPMALEQPNPLSRTGSSQYAGLSTSPPVPGSSAASQHMSWGMPFSPEFSQGASSTVNTSLGALASPALSMGNQQAAKQTGKQGQSANGPQNGFPFAFNPGQSGFVPQGWSPQQMVNSQGFARGGSPAFNFNGMQRMGSAFSQDSPDVFGGQQTPRAFDSGPSPFAPSTDASTKVSRSNTLLSQRPITPEQDGADNEDQQRTPGARQESSYPDLAYPTPRGHSHRHNISANLEREVENPEYYPGEYVNENGIIEKRGGPSDFKFGAGSAFAPGRSIGHQSMLSTASNTSQSRLNVNAKEFKFDPASAHGRQFSVSKNAFLPASQAQPQVSMITAHANNKGSTSSTTLNVTAPAFKPPEQSKFSFASLGFNFSGKKDANAEKKPEETQEEEKRDSPAGPKIFNHIETSDIVIPTKKSKAIDIVNPAMAKKPSPKSAKDADTDNEDETGRLGPDKGRAKRGRFAGADGDEVPKFATPTPEPEPAPVVLPSNATAKETFGPKLASPPKAVEPTEKLVDVSDNDWHEPDLSTAWHEPEKKRDRVTQPNQAPTAVEPAIATRTKKEPRPILQSYVPPHKRQSLPYPDDQIKENNASTPTFDQIDDVMGALNDNNSDFGIEEGPKSRGRSPTKPPVSEARKSPGTASPLAPLDPKRLAQLGNQPALSPRGLSADWLRDQANRSSESPVRKINSVKDPQISDWDDILPASEDLPQAQFFDTRVKNLIEGVIRAQLSPLTSQLKDVRASMTRISRDQQDAKLLSSHEKSSSDADDEDDIDVPPMPRTASRAASHKADKKMEHIRVAVADALRNAQVGGGSNDALEREISKRHDAERRADELKRLNDMSEQEIMLYKESAENQSHKIRALEDTRKLGEDRVGELEQENDVLQSTLEEYRNSSKKWRQEIDNAKSAREILTGTIEKMRNESEAERTVRQETSQNLQQMQEALTEASANLARERSVWQSRTQDQAKESATLETKLEEALRVRTRQEEEIERLALQEKLAIKSAIALEESRNTNSKMEVEIAKLRADLQEHQSTASRFERDAMDAQDNAKTEAQRVRTLMEAEVEAATKRAEHSKVELETRIEILRAELEGSHANAETTKQEHTRLLEESFTARKQALEDSHQTAMSKLADQQTRFEQQINDLTVQHQRELNNGVEDKHRIETHLSSSLKLADEKIVHYLDKITHLEDKVKVSQAAAEAAAVAARSATGKAPVVAAPVPAPVPAPASVGPAPHTVTERVSPQALRESIVVLQEQLQERESQIERLEQDLADADKEAPAKLRVAETEISWLREVLNVRVDDLTDLVNNLTMEKFDRGAARNAAIRIRANIEMEKQEKERIARGEPRTVPLPSLTDLQNFATPKAAQLAAAWGNWRKGGQSPMATMRGALAGHSGVDETPSKKPSPAPRNEAPQDLSSAQSFLSGLMTPPASNLRRTPSTGPSTQRPLQSAVAEPKLSYPFPQRGGEISPTRGGNREGASHDEPPTTPRLLRHASYDEDAADARSINYPTSDAEESPRKGGPARSMEDDLAGAADDYEEGGEEEDESTMVNETESLPTGEDEVTDPADKIAQDSALEPLGDAIASESADMKASPLKASRWA
ncbi:hypothetical protein FH972_022194 [Carpinus fangiana]|uniref:Myosin class II heavy chain n=1 Tax=Carpinus fangiana TaxID=176857 RepID=A0A5N6KTR3_9ROSI|nr:hypothetical protein FH972_022194 [Carpinus fangiana]